MRQPINSSSRHQVVRGLQVIWLAFVAAAAFYTLIITLLVYDSDGPELPLLDVVRPIFWLLAGILAIASCVWRLQIPNIQRASKGPTTPGFARLRVACIVTWSLCEGIAALGIVLGFMSNHFLDYFPFVTLGIVLLFVHRPAAWPIERFLGPGFP